MPDDLAELKTRVAELTTEVAVLKVQMATMKDDQSETVKLLKQCSTDIHSIKETIAAGRGAWWAAGIVLTLIAAVAGGAGAAFHKLTSG